MKWLISSEQNWKSINNGDTSLMKDLRNIKSTNMSSTSFFTQFESYFIDIDKPGFRLYNLVNSQIESVLIKLLSPLGHSDLSFHSPYSRKEMAVLWTSYNMISEILEWGSDKLLNSPKSHNNSFLRSTLPFLFDGTSIIVSLRMRQMVENNIYGPILQDRNKWGFLLKGLDKQIFSQIMNVSIDLAGILSSLVTSDTNNISSILTNLGILGTSATNLVFIKQSLDGLFHYSNSQASVGWFAWFIQELGFLQDNQLIGNNISSMTPISLNIISNLLSILTMGMVLYQS